MSDITKFDVTEHIRTKVRETLLSAIPDEQMDRMIQAEFDSFFRERRDSFSTFSKPSPFQEKVREVLWSEMEKSLRTWIEQHLAQHWATHGEAALKELVTSYMASAHQAMIEQMLKHAFESLGYNVWVNK